MAETRLLIGLVTYLAFVSIVVGYIASNIGVVGGVPDPTAMSAAGSSSILSLPGSFVSILANIALLLVWNVPEMLVPWWCNILFIKIPAMAVIWLLGSELISVIGGMIGI